jgi:hypothetical protein
VLLLVPKIRGLGEHLFLHHVMRAMVRASDGDMERSLPLLAIEITGANRVHSQGQLVHRHSI